MRYVVTIDGEELLVDVDRTSDGRFRAAIVGDGGPEPAETWSALPGTSAAALTLIAGERVLELVLAPLEDRLDVYADGERLTAKIESARTSSGRPRARASAEVGAVIAPMPGKVVKVLVRSGDMVDVGTPLVVVEAMKMENELFAKAAGRVRNVSVSQGDAVDRGAVLMNIEPW